MPQQPAVDFELTLRGTDGSYWAEYTLDRGGDSAARGGPFKLAFDLPRLGEVLIDPESYGLALTEMLFPPGALREAFAEARGAAAALHTNLRLRLELVGGAEELQALSWELLHLPGHAERLCTREDILFSRFLSVGAGALPPAPRATLRALAAIAVPKNARMFGLDALDMAYERERVQAGLAGMHIEWLPAAPNQPCTLDQLAACTPDKDVLYLVCHGKLVKGQSWLFLQDEDGQVALVSAQDLARRLAGSLSLPRLAVLVVCKSAGDAASSFLGLLAPRLVEIGIPAVIAMQSNLSFATANLFLPALFRELQKDGLIDRAVAVARRAILERVDEHAPVLFLGLKSGLLWSPAADVPAPAISTGQAAAIPPRAAPQLADQYNLRNVRELLLDSFNPESLENMLRTSNDLQLRKAVRGFAPKMGMPDRADVVLEYCLRFLLIDQLLQETKTENPLVFAQYQSLIYRQNP
jgi:hypothetical protein